MEESRHLIGRSEMPEIGRRSKPIGGIEVASSRDGGEDLREICIATMGIVGVVGRDARDLKAVSHLEKDVVAGVVVRHAVMGEFDEEPTGKDLAQPGCGGHRICQVSRLCGPGYGSTATPGQGDETPVAGGDGKVVV
jgi:hypothetical protein